MPWTSTGLWAVSNQVTQQKVSGRQPSTCIFSSPSSLLLPPELCLLSDPWWGYRSASTTALESSPNSLSPSPGPGKNFLTCNWSLVPKMLGTSALRDRVRQKGLKQIHTHTPVYPLLLYYLFLYDLVHKISESSHVCNTDH